MPYLPILAQAPSFDVGATAWVLTSAALVLFMTPGLAFFYGGMVRAKTRARHADAELLRHGPDQRPLGGRGVQPRLRWHGDGSIGDFAFVGLARSATRARDSRLHR